MRFKCEHERGWARQAREDVCANLARMRMVLDGGGQRRVEGERRRDLRLQLAVAHRLSNRSVLCTPESDACTPSLSDRQTTLHNATSRQSFSHLGMSHNWINTQPTY
eukprot:1507821-Rhodomonas_salina.1